MNRRKRDGLLSDLDVTNRELMEALVLLPLVLIVVIGVYFIALIVATL